MIHTHKKIFVNVVDIIIILLLYLQTSQEAVPPARCPVGFNESYAGLDAICYHLKGKETFADNFRDCPGNRFTLELYQKFSLPQTNESIWTGYKTAYDGGPYVTYTGDPLEGTIKVHRDSRYSVNEELCVVVDQVVNYTAVRCNEMHYSYCVVKPYPDDQYDLLDDDDCKDLVDPSGSEEESLRFLSPVSTCLMRLGSVRTTWETSRNMCIARGGSLLNHGWIYSNHNSFSNEKSTKKKLDSPVYPLGIRFNYDFTLLTYVHDLNVIPRSEWNFGQFSRSGDKTLGAVKYNETTWHLVDKSNIFYDVICERAVPLRYVNLTLSIKSDKITLTVNDTDLNRQDILCFTDSYNYYPQRVNLNSDSSTHTHTYVLKPKQNGYYWCTFWENVKDDKRTFHSSESNKILYIKVVEETQHIYAVKLTHSHDYSIDNIETLVNFAWRNKLEEFVSSVNNETTLAKTHVVQGLVLKRIYQNSRTALLHVKLHPHMRPVMPGLWKDIDVEYMNPVYYCDTKTNHTMGETRWVSECEIYKCVGNFNEGVRTVMTAETTCLAKKTTHPQRESDSSEEDPPRTDPPKPDSPRTDPPPPETTTNMTSYTTEEPLVETESTIYTSSKPPPKPPKPTTTAVPIITTEPTFPTTVPTTVPTMVPTTFKPPPQEQLQQVMDDLGSLLNTTDAINVEDINPAFDQVDVFLGDQEDLEIPSDLLHLLDEVGSRLHLPESEAAAVRDNVALVVADAEPARPVRGLRIANRTSDLFTADAFQIIREDIDSTLLQSDASEVVVRLPESATGRVSFVVFRTDRAFHSEPTRARLNSRVLSVNVENVTQFHDGEVIDIHLSPLESDPAREEARSCAYWHFDTDGTGYWSQEGCTFIKSKTAGTLDLCRCDHLTHFAEILIPRTVFSERHENALEIISITGCVLSMLGLILVGVTALVFRSWRRDFNNKIWLQLCISIFILMLSFLIIVFAQFEVYDVGCMLTGILLHYSTLSSFSWMLVAAVLSYKRLVKVFTRDASHKLLRAAAFAWGLPFAVIGVLLSVDPHAYAGIFDEKNPAAYFCYPTGLAVWLSVYAPIGAMVLANWTLFALILRSVFGSRRIQRHGADANETLRCVSVSFFLVFLFGLPWLFGLFAMNIVMAYLYAILCTFQGFVLFLFFVLGNKNTRDLWLNKLKIKQTRKIPVTSSTFTNRSTDGNVNSRGGAGESLAARAAKPRSLASADDARFS